MGNIKYRTLYMLCRSFLEPTAKTIHAEVNVLCAVLETLRTMFVKLVQVLLA